MNRIQKVFSQHKSLLNIFITAGYPEKNSLPKLSSNLFKSGIDMIEVGMPYSDPLADGPVIQNTSAIALRNGISLSLIFEQIQVIRKTEKQAPIFLMGYLNQLMQYGIKTFLQKCKEVEVDGLIIPDLPYDVYLTSYKELFNQYEIAISFLITPQTTAERIRALDDACNSFLYIVSDNSITGGTKGSFGEGQLAYFKRIKNMKLKNPTMIGFGISSKSMLLEAGEYANGAIIGTAYLEAIRNNEDEAFIRALTH